MFPVIATLIPAFIAAIMGVVFFTRMRKLEYKNLFLPKGQLIIGFSLIAIGLACYSPQHPPLTFRIISIFSVHLGALIVCISTRSLVLPQARPVSKYTITIIVVISIATNIFDVLRGSNDGLYLKGEPFRATVEYLLYVWLLLGNLTIICFIYARTHWCASKICKLYPSRIRMRAMTYAHALNVFNSLLGPINLSLYYLGFSRFFSTINSMFYILLDVSFICTLYTFLPKKLFIFISRPIISLLEHIDQEKQRKLANLHALLVKIAPKVQLPGDNYQKERILVEISHTRRIIWSHINTVENISEFDEITYLQQLVDQDVVFDKAGPYPPPPKLADPERYYNRIATILDKRNRKMASNNIPAIKGIPFLGSLWEFMYDRLGLLQRISSECGDIGSARIASDTIIVLNHPDYIKDILIEYSYNGTKPRSVRESLRPAIGESLLVIEGETHRKRRKLLAPHFQYRQVTSYIEIMVDCAEKVQKRWIDGNLVDINNEMLRLTLDVLGKTLFNTEIDIETSDVGKALIFVSQYINDYLASPIRIPTSWPTPRNTQYKRALVVLEETLNRMTSERKTGNHRDILSTLLQIKDDENTTIPPQQSKHEALSLFIGANDTTHHAMIWMLYLVSQHKDVQKRIQEEIDNTINRKCVDVSDLPSMPFSLQVVKETLRLYSPVYIIVRTATKPITIDNKYHIEPGDHFVISPYILHRRSDYYPNPEQFDPDRFALNNEIPHYAYLPFGAGPHACIGNHFAMLEMQIALITIFQHITLEIENPQNVKPSPLTTLQLNSTVYARVKQRF